MDCMMKFMMSVGLAVLCGLPVAQASGLYKWVDSQGRVSYQDRPPPEGSGFVEQKDIAVERKASGGNDADKTSEKYPVVLYSAPNCNSCDLARAYLKKRNVPFTEYNVEGNVELQKTMKEKVGSLSVPTITIGSKVMKGYLESLLEGELTDAGYPNIDKAATANVDKEN